MKKMAGSTIKSGYSPSRMALLLCLALLLSTCVVAPNYSLRALSEMQPPTQASNVPHPLVYACYWWDFSADGRRDLLEICSRRVGTSLTQELCLRDGNDLQNVLARLDLTAFQVWDLLLADVNGDGSMEIALPAYKSTPLQAELARRPFIYAYDQAHCEFRPFWRGSRLALPFEALAFFDYDVDGAAELLAVELNQQGAKRLAIYQRAGFSFWCTWASDFYADLRILQARLKSIDLSYVLAGQSVRLQLCPLDQSFVRACD